MAVHIKAMAYKRVLGIYMTSSLILVVYDHSEFFLRTIFRV